MVIKMSVTELIQNEHLRNILVDDYKMVCAEISCILRMDRVNGTVKNCDYLSPSVPLSNLSDDKPLNNTNALFYYFMKIREALEIVLTTGSLPADKLPDGAPSYLCDLVRGEQKIPEETPKPEATQSGLEVGLGE